MKAGFAKVCITPPLGTRMMGFGSRDREKGCTGIHDDVFVRALYLEDGREKALIVSYDMCFLGREEADRFKGAIGRRLDILPRQVLLNATHSHAGPAAGPWCYGELLPQDPLYLDDLETATVRGAVEAADRARDVTLRAGVGRSSVPMNRRRIENGRAVMAPNPEGMVCDALPVCLINDRAGAPVALIFSVSCHPSVVSGWEISAEFPGVATNLLDERLGAEGSLFLQGAGGDAKPSSMYAGEPRWPVGTWEMVERAGRTLYEEVSAVIDGEMSEIEPSLASASTEMSWPLQPAPPREEFERIAADESVVDWKRHWARKQLRILDRGGALATRAILTAQGIRIGKGLRIIAIEGELLAPHGNRIIDYYRGGVTFPLGYSNGTGLYLPTSDDIDEGGMEVTSYAEYGYPAPLAKGMEDILDRTLAELRARGVE